MKIKVDLASGILLFLSSIISLLLPIFIKVDTIFILRYFFTIYMIINLIRYICNRKSKDIEGLLTSIFSIIFFFLTFVPLHYSLSISLFLFIFVIVNSFIRLIKADYYHDRKQKIWILEITCLLVFILSGLLTSFSILLYPDEKVLFIGFLFFMNGFMEILDPIVHIIKES